MRTRVLLLVGWGLLAGDLSAQPDPPRASGSDRHFTHQTATRASRAAIWRRWADVASWPSWDHALQAASLDGPFVSGTRGRLTPDKGPAARFRLVAVEDGIRYTFRTDLPLGALDVTRRFAPDSAGFTRFVHDVHFRGTLGWLWARMYGPRYRRALPQVMARLGALAEADSSGGATRAP